MSDIIREVVSTDREHVVIAMRRYPRFINRALRDEYVIDLSAVSELLEDFLALKRGGLGHDAGFTKAGFERRFKLNELGLEALSRLSVQSRKEDVVLICQCETGRRCHRELLLLMARELYGARTAPLFHDYPVFVKRVAKGEAELLLPPVEEKKPKPRSSLKATSPRTPAGTRAASTRASARPRRSSKLRDARGG